MQWFMVVGIAALGWLSCEQPADTSKPFTLRVSTGNELSSKAGWSGSIAYVGELVYESVREHADLVPVNSQTPPTQMTLRNTPSSPYDAAFLCGHVCPVEGMIARRVVGKVGERRCVLEFATPEALGEFASSPRLLIDSGTFRRGRMWTVNGREVAAPRACEMPTAPEPVRTIELVARVPGPIARIEITAMPISEEWRRLFAGQLDVIPKTPMLFWSHFEHVRSVRRLSLPVSSLAALFFNTQHAEWSNRDLRRYVANLIDRRGVANLACGVSDCAVADWLPEPAVGAFKLPARISILALSSDSAAQIAAEAISYQIRRHHAIRVDIERIPLEEMVLRTGNGDFDLMVAPLAILSASPPERIRRIVKACSGYADDAFGDALDEAAMATHIGVPHKHAWQPVEQILASAVPLLPLYENRMFAAVDARLCGGRPVHATSWGWLADLHPCNRGDSR